MKLTKKFWIWISQVFTLIFLVFRVDLVLQLFKLIPNADVSQIYPEIAGFALIVVIWGSILVWCGIKGFSGEMPFLLDPHDRRRW